MSPTGTAAADRTFLAHLGPWDVLGLRVGSLRGRERLSAPYRFDVRALTPEVLGPERIPPAGTPMTLALFTEDGGRHEPRFVHGLLTRTQHHGTDHDREGSWLGLRLEPRLVLLRRHRTRRVFQERTVAQIADMLLAPHRVPWRWAGELPTQRIAYAVQYDETDFDFFRRLLARFGVLFFFEQAARASGADAHETLVLCDDARHYAQLASLEGTQLRTLHYAHGDARVRTDEALLSLEPVTRVRSTAVRLRDVDVRTPQQLPDHMRGVETEAALGRDMLRVEDFEHRSGNDEVHFRPLEARIALEQARAGSVEVFGRTDCAALSVGTRFATGDHPIDALNARWVVTELVHEAHVPTLIPHVGTGAPGQAVSYENSIRAVPADQTVRPARPARVLRQVCETAVVVGPTNEEVFTDTLGRIKVQFHWDREGHYNEQSSCWVRVAQSLAGNGWGSQFLPRVGMEVLVTYVAGDTDHPLVTACLYNGSAAPPFVLPATRTRSGLRTHSSPGGLGYNELSFEDAAGHEEVYLRAERDLRELVQNDRTTSVAHDDALAVGASQRIDVGEDRAVSVRGNARVEVFGGRTTEVHADERVTVRGSTRQTTDGSLSVDVGGDAHFEVHGDASASLRGNHRLFVDGTSEVTISNGSGAESAPALVLYVAGPASATLAGPMMVSVERGFVLRCGTSRIDIGPTEISIEADALTVRATRTAQFATLDASLRLDRGAELAGSTVVAEAGEGARLTLDANALVVGRKVSLKTGANSIRTERPPEEGPITPRVFQLSTTPPRARCAVELVVLDGARRVVRVLGTVPPSETPPGALSVTVAIDELPVPVQIAWRDGEALHTVVGPCDPHRLHASIREKNWDHASSSVARRRGSLSASEE